MVSKASDAKGLGGLGHLESESSVSDARGQRRGLGGLRPETFSGSDTCGPWLGPVNYWACSVRLIYDPTVLIFILLFLIIVFIFNYL
jgi:hypothetical protein